MAPWQGIIESADGKAVAADFSFLTTASVLFDAVYVPGGASSIETLAADADACHFVDEAYKHCKAICTTGGTDLFIDNTYAATAEDDVAVIIASKPSEAADNFINAIAQHGNREKSETFLRNDGKAITRGLDGHAFYWPGSFFRAP